MIALEAFMVDAYPVFSRLVAKGRLIREHRLFGHIDRSYAVRRDLLGAGSVLLTRRLVRSAVVACRMVRYALEVVREQDQGQD